MSAPISPKRNMTDIHMHLIPGVDDGAENMEMALVMMIRAMDQGITRIVATPHSSAFAYSAQGGRSIFRRLAEQAAKVCLDMKLYLGCEVYCEADRMDQVLEALKTGQYPTMNETDYVLMEFSQWVRPEGAVSCVEAMVKAGWKPIIAHMERYRHLCGDMELTDRFRTMGAMIQINAYSLFDEMDDSIRNWASVLVQERRADFLGSDGHRTYHRPPSVERGLKWLYENVDEQYADAVAFSNAAHFLAL